jgi:multidrug efflux pump subunit AcrA (membrane-fusion protein)
MDTEVDVQNPGLTLIPGMYAEVNLHIAESRGALVVPLDAVDRSTTAARVYVVTPQVVIQIVPVTLGLETDRNVEVLNGLTEGDTVVAGRHAGLRDGQRVQANEGAQPK